MSYTPQQWVDGQTKVDAQHLNHIEQGIAGVYLAVYTKSEVDAKLVSVVRYAGSVPSFEDLPKDARVGDVYIVGSDSWAWNGTEWDHIDQVVDLTPYLTKTEAGELYITAEAVDGKLDTLLAELGAKYITADVLNTELEALGRDLADKYQPKGNYVEYQEFQRESDDQPRLTIQLGNHDTISGKLPNGTAINIAMVSKWGIADYGSSTTPMNLNSKDGIVTINDKFVVPYLKKFVAGSEPDERYTLELPNFYNISGLSTEGVGANLIMMSKWDIVDVGSAQFPMNLNAKDGVVKINDKQIIATTDQIPTMVDIATSTEIVDLFNSMQAKIDELKAKVGELEAKIG